MGFATVQVVVAGAPEHAMVTVPEYPGPGVSCTLYCAVWPAVTVAASEAAGLVTVNAEAFTVPVTVTVCGELAALSVRVIVSVRAVALAGVSGAKLTEMVQFAFGAMAVVQELAGFTNSETFAPPKATPVICSGAFPVFVIVTVPGALTVPCVADNVSGFGAIETVELAAVPVPVSVALCGLAGALSAT